MIQRTSAAAARRTPGTRRRLTRLTVAASVVALGAGIVGAYGPGTPPATAATTSADPTASTTGVPADTSLRVHDGDLTITRAGTVIDGLDIRGYVDVQAANVTIRNSIIRGSADGERDALVQSASNTASLTIVDSELVGANHADDGLRGWNISATRVDIRNVHDGGHFWGAGNVSLRDSRIQGTLGDDGIQIQGGANFQIVNNRIDGAPNEAIQLTQDAGATSDVRISGNHLDSGACVVNLAQKSYGPLQGISITNNVFGTSSRFDCAITKPESGTITVDGNVSVDGVDVDGGSLLAASPAPAPAPAPVVAGGMPGPDNTGVPAGVSLQVHNGDMVITQPGTVIDGLDIHGFVEVRAANVTIRNSIIRGGAEGDATSLVRSASDSASLTITDSELVSTIASPTIDGLRGWNITAERLDIHHVLDGVHLWGAGNVTMRDSWVHDILHFENDPGWNGGPSHDDTVQIQSGSNITLTGNRIEGAYNAGIILTQDAGPISNVRITDNWLDGGGCTVNISEKSYGPLQGIVVSGNTFGDNSGFDCHVIYPSTSNITLTGNETVDGGPLKYVKR